MPQMRFPVGQKRRENSPQKIEYHTFYGCFRKSITNLRQKSSYTSLPLIFSFKSDERRHLHMYYRSLFQLFKYIKLSPILSGYSQRKKYYDIIQSNMSDTELLLFLCFVLGGENRDKKIFGLLGSKQSFKDLIDEGHVLKNCYVPDEALLRRMTPILRQSFPKTAIKSFHFFLLRRIWLRTNRIPHKLDDKSL